MSLPVTLSDIEHARTAIEGYVLTTPIIESPSLSKLAGFPVHLKLEQLQTTGSFKVRGATTAVRRLDELQRSRGVVGVSTGNHGRGLAYAAHSAGVRCIICMSQLVPQNKIEGIRSHGAEVRIVGRSQDDAQVEVDRLVSEEGMTMLPPFDHPDIIAGQGTLGLELLGQITDLDTLLVPVSGGGLVSGVATAIKALQPQVRIIGVSMQRGAAMYASLRAGQPIMVEELPTLADSLGGGIGMENQYTFRMVRELVDDFVLVSELEIAAAIRHAYWHDRQIVEGSGSVCIAALLTGKIKAKGPVVALCTGGNIDMKLHYRVISGEDVDVTEQEQAGA